MIDNIKYSDLAINDLEQIGDYISEQLKNPKSALKIVNDIQDTIDTLVEFPLMGVLLSSVIDIETDYRFLVCGSYLTFYRPQDSKIFIDRILYSRRNYLTILFGDTSQDEEIE